MHTAIDLKVFYFGTPVVLITTRNPDGSTNIGPMSSAWWLGTTCMLGMNDSSRTARNMLRERECVLNLPSAQQAAPVNRIALVTGEPEVPEHKIARGYTHEPDKFGAAGLTEQESEIVGAARILECPVQIECAVVDAGPFFRRGVTAFQADTRRVHVDEDLVIPGTDYIDPLKWDPLIMKFCEYFGEGQPVHSSELARGWRMPHHMGEPEHLRAPAPAG
ncbi:flavin reductase family protein [Sciscionella sediminilitoris]|uniref:flavin reductase family protein n=1 Tax=Sciscionella sediminilitoris TaxID=1445613 RepID=UPI0004DF9265|nr:flavin reductase family protein [Sciscionella sp. SE31]